MKTFDATIDFETDELNDAIRDALDAHPEYEPGAAFTVVVRADGCLPGSSEETNEAELYIGEEEIPELSDDDWCVTERTVVDAAAALRALL